MNEHLRVLLLLRRRLVWLRCSARCNGCGSRRRLSGHRRVSAVRQGPCSSPGSLVPTPLRPATSAASSFGRCSRTMLRSRLGRATAEGMGCTWCQSQRCILVRSPSRWFSKPALQRIDGASCSGRSLRASNCRDPPPQHLKDATRWARQLWITTSHVGRRVRRSKAVAETCTGGQRPTQVLLFLYSRLKYAIRNDICVAVASRLESSRINSTIILDYTDQ